MTPERLAEIKKRESKATPGPWETEGHSGAVAVSPVPRHPEATKRRVACMVADCPEWPWNEWQGETFYPGASYNASFIAHARTDVPDLVAEVERLRLALQNITNVLGPLEACDEFFCSNDCEGCRNEMAEALAIATTALNG